MSEQQIVHQFYVRKDYRLITILSGVFFLKLYLLFFTEEPDAISSYMFMGFSLVFVALILKQNNRKSPILEIDQFGIVYMNKPISWVNIQRVYWQERKGFLRDDVFLVIETSWKDNLEIPIDYVDATVSQINEAVGSWKHHYIQ